MILDAKYMYITKKQARARAITNTIIILSSVFHDVHHRMVLLQQGGGRKYTLLFYMYNCVVTCTSKH